MKPAKLTHVFALGFLTVLLAGCFNPITVTPPDTADPLVQPFTVDVLIGEDVQARSVAGPDADRIKGSISNIVQLIVVDDSGTVVAFDEVRRKNKDEEKGELWIESIRFGQNYHFLLLIGHWERNYEAEEDGGDYEYKAGVSPTLLAAGLKTQHITGSGKVTITMWPIVVDTVFTTSDEEVPAGSRTVAPAITNGKPQTVNLLPVDWNITWTVKRGTTGNGFADLVKAQKKIPDSLAGDKLLLRSKKTILRADDFTGDPDQIYGKDIENTITRNIKDYTSGVGRIGISGSANFVLEYVPFNLDDPDAWTMVTGEGDEANTLFDMDEGVPVWIIRNGVTDLAQDEDTDFENLGKTGYADANGNGAVSFTVTAGTPDEGTLEISNGVFEDPDTEEPYVFIGFETSGYEDEAEVYYAVVPHSDESPAPAPPYSTYTRLGSFEEGVHTRQRIRVLSNNDDVYVILMKGGKIGGPINIKTGSGGSGVGWDWGVNVENITGVPTVATVGTGLVLSGMVEPANATYRTIEWSVKALGNTGARIDNGNTLNTTGAGEVTITATIVNAAYSKDFTITVSPLFVAVENITEVPTAATAGIGLALAGTVEPINATNQGIAWSVTNAGNTGAEINGSTLNTTGAGTVTVTATIANGKANGEAYTKNFTITVSLPFVPVSMILLNKSSNLSVAHGDPFDTYWAGYFIVAPSNATNREIIWTLPNSGGDAGAYFLFNDDPYRLSKDDYSYFGVELWAERVGTFMLTATVPNGNGPGDDYSITIPITAY
jgi:hypothetical protein